MYIYIPKPGLNEKYFYIKTQKKLLNILNGKKSIKISYFENLRKIILLLV